LLVFLLSIYSCFVLNFRFRWSVSCSHKFAYTGSLQSMIVPPSVSIMQVDLTGAAGGTIAIDSTGSDRAGWGARVTSTFVVTPGDTLYIYVGGQGTSTGGWNGGGEGASRVNYKPNNSGGGGASDIRIGGTALSNRIIVAGGGGGYHYPCYTPYQRGGDAGEIGALGGSIQSSCCCGWTDGGNPCCGNDFLLAGGGGGSSTSGGAAGESCVGYVTYSGSLGNGGGGGTNGGGGGGGYYGGGGGPCGGAGGGGSSYTSGTSTTYYPGVQSGNGEVTITFVSSSTAVPSTTNSSSGAVYVEVIIPVIFGCILIYCCVALVKGLNPFTLKPLTGGGKIVADGGKEYEVTSHCPTKVNGVDGSLEFGNRYNQNCYDN
jgi:hypothetical protein